MFEPLIAAAARLIANAWRALPGSGKAWLPAVLFALAGVGAVAASILPGPGVDDGWTRDLLMTIGASLALFAPFYLITRSLDGHLDEVQAETRAEIEVVRDEAAASSAEIRSNFETFQADVDRRLSTFADSVSAELAAEAADDTAAFNSLRTDEPTRQSIFRAFDRAHELGLITTARPPRVKASEGSWLYVSVQFDPDEYADHLFMLRVEEVDGTVLDRIPWDDDESVAEILVKTGRAIRRRAGDVFDPALLLVGLADLFDAAATSADRRPAIELCSPQWMVCDGGIVATSGDYGGAYLYTLTVDQLRADRDVSFVTGKPWVDFDSFDRARAVAVELFPDRSSAWTFTGGETEPPF